MCVSQVVDCAFLMPQVGPVESDSAIQVSAAVVEKLMRTTHHSDERHNVGENIMGKPITFLTLRMPPLCRNIWFIGCCIVLTACTQTNTAASNTASQTGAAAIAKLQLKVNRLESTVEDNAASIAGINARLNVDESQWSSADFDPMQPGFERIDALSGIGIFAVSVQDVRPFGDGVRVKLGLGNLLTATISGVSLKIKYGPREPSLTDPNFAIDFSKWQRAVQSESEGLTASLRPGSWNPVYINLPGIKPQNFGYISISISTKEIVLSKY